MNDEIKEILDDLKNTGYEKLAKNIENIIDYITNLQQEKEKLKYKLKNKECLRNTRLDDDYVTIPKLKYKNITDLQIKTIKEKEDYKSRCEKAIEYIKDNCSYEEDTKYCYDDLCSSDVNSLLYILQNGSEENA